ncbi:MAG: exo-alpha-sialidase, partial [Actinomycetota bacterium]
MRRVRFSHVFALLLVLGFGASQLVSSSAQSAPPTLTAGTTSLSLQAWHLDAQPPATSLILCEQGVNCSARDVNVAISPAIYQTSDRLMTAHLEWASAKDNLDLYVCRTESTGFKTCLDNLVGSSSRRGTRSETVRVIDPRPGTYRIVVADVAGAPSYSLHMGMSQPRSAASAKTTAPVRSSDGGYSWYATPVSDQSSFGEPSIDVDHSGGIYITAPGGAGVQMWRSFNGGKSFDHKEISSPNGGGDSEVDFNSTDVGFTADLEIQDSAVSRSTNRFNKWTQQPVGIEQDRQWLENKCDKTMYLVYHDFAAETVDLNRSDDGGKTWSQVPTPVTNDGDAPGTQDVVEGADQGANTFQGPMAVNQQNGDVYVVFAISSSQGNVTTGTPPYGDPEQIVVASSRDNGQTFDLKLVQGGGPGEAAGEIFPWITIDKAGTVYVSYAYRAKDTDPLNIVMTYSKDRGQTWSKPHVVNTDNTSGSHIYATVSGGDPGKVDVAWYTGDKIDPANTNQDWHVDFAQVTNADTGNPTVHQSRPYPGRIHHGDVCLNGLLCIAGGDRSLL